MAVLALHGQDFKRAAWPKRVQERRPTVEMLFGLHGNIAPFKIDTNLSTKKIM